MYGSLNASYRSIVILSCDRLAVVVVVFTIDDRLQLRCLISSLSIAAHSVLA